MPDPIRSVLTVLIPDAALEAEVNRALDAIDGVHGITGDPQQVPIRAFSAPPEIAGGYVQFPDGTVDILINDASDDVSFTALHEIGHFLDDQAIGSRGTFASTTVEATAEWWAAVDGSEAVNRLRELERQAPVAFGTPNGFAVILEAEDLAYRLAPEELFARSYAQYIAARSGDRVTLSELRAAQGIVYPEQWSDDDFRPIAAAFDELLERLGWSGS